MIRKLIIGVSLAILVGCTQELPVAPKPVLHPDWPDQIQPWTGQWQVKVIDGQPWVGMPFEESQEFRIWLNDVFRYVNDANGMACYYRKDLNETRCK